MAVLQGNLKAHAFTNQCAHLTYKANGAIGAVAKDRIARKAIDDSSAFVTERDLHGSCAGACEVDRKALSRHGDRFS